MPRERPNIALNPVELACERLKQQRKGEQDVHLLNPDRDLTWENSERTSGMDFNFDDNYYYD